MLTFRVHQGLILGILFTMCRNIDIENLHDDNMAYISTEKVDEFMKPLEQALVSLFKRFELNLLKGNTDKFVLW